jgi:NADH-quinone oxidoreductase subunit C
MTDKEQPPQTKAAGDAPPAGPRYEPLAPNPIAAGINQRWPGACPGAWSFLDQWLFDVSKDRLVEIGRWLRDEMRFDMCADVTAVHYPDRARPFTVIYNLYSIADNQRILLRAELGADEAVPSVTGVWPSAGWTEREVFDMFGIRFDGHPDLRRILMPPDWTGHPLRKDYDLRGRDPQWIARHLELRVPDETPKEETPHE